ncbi:hypothetical protein [Embleya sp. NBC_00896]|uniref:hypothetical protein n=1 Tax=Embleya sp. NBC_00896 TaxID=2975961 RepID=UPI002F90FC5F|nr:hypothetical protein OG928_48565 [Embleya sp. NBC_00896]
MSARTVPRSFRLSDDLDAAAEKFVNLLGDVDMKWIRRDRQHEIALTSVDDVTRPNRMAEVFETLEAAGWTFDALGIGEATMSSPDDLTHLSVSMRIMPSDSRARWGLTLTPAPYTQVITSFRNLGFVIRLEQHHEGVGRLLRVENGSRTVYVGTDGTETGALPESPADVHRWRAVGMTDTDKDTDAPWIHSGGSLSGWSRFVDEIAHWLTATTEGRQPRRR